MKCAAMERRDSIRGSAITCKILELNIRTTAGKRKGTAALCAAAQIVQWGEIDCVEPS